MCIDSSIRAKLYLTSTRLLSSSLIGSIKFPKISIKPHLHLAGYLITFELLQAILHCLRQRGISFITSTVSAQTSDSTVGRRVDQTVIATKYTCLQAHAIVFCYRPIS